MAKASCGAEMVTVTLLQEQPNTGIKEVRVDICPVHQVVLSESGIGDYVADNPQVADMCVPRVVAVS